MEIRGFTVGRASGGRESRLGERHPPIRCISRRGVTGGQARVGAQFIPNVEEIEYQNRCCLSSLCRLGFCLHRHGQRVRSFEVFFRIGHVFASGQGPATSASDCFARRHIGSHDLSQKQLCARLLVY